MRAIDYVALYTVCDGRTEVWFASLSRKCLKRADLANATIATQQIEGFITAYNTHLAHPFTP